MPTLPPYGLGSERGPAASTSYLTQSGGPVLKLQRGSRKFTNQYGADELTRRFEVPLDRSAQNEPQLGQPDFYWQDLKVWDFEIIEQETHAIIAVKYNGYTGGRRPRVYKPKYSSQYQSVPIGGGGGQVNIVYISPSVTTTYSSLERPSDQEDFALLPDGEIRIVEIHGTDQVGLVNTDKESRDWITKFQLKAINIRPIFDREPEGALWMCSEQVHTVLIQDAWADIPRLRPD